MDTLSLRADYTYTDAIDAATKLALARRPRNRLSLTGDWQALPDLDLDATLLVTGPQCDIGRESGITREDRRLYRAEPGGQLQADRDLVPVRPD